MAGTQVTNGKAFEYALANAYSSYLQEQGVFLNVVDNDAYKSAKRFYDSLAFVDRKKFDYCAALTIDSIVKLEPGLKDFHIDEPDDIIIFNGKSFPFTIVIEKVDDDLLEIEHIVSVQALESELFDKKGYYISNKAQSIDKQITYFVEKVEHLKWSNDYMLKQIYD